MADEIRTDTSWRTRDNDHDGYCDGCEAKTPDTIKRLIETGEFDYLVNGRQTELYSPIDYVFEDVTGGTICIEVKTSPTYSFSGVPYILLEPKKSLKLETINDKGPEVLYVFSYTDGIAVVNITDVVESGFIKDVWNYTFWTDEIKQGVSKDGSKYVLKIEDRLHLPKNLCTFYPNDTEAEITRPEILWHSNRGRRPHMFDLTKPIDKRTIERVCNIRK